MQRKVKFTIPGEPIAQGRPRFSTHGGFARAYDPKKSRDGKSVVKLCARDAVEESGITEPLNGPLVMKIQFGIPLPKSAYRKRTPVTRAWRTKKPDLDNLVKLVKDACSGVIYLDDNQIARIVAEKITCGQDEPPYTKVLFAELEELDPL
jgi:Holliday junction resolvase RusA-like endonuclease